MPLLFLSRVLRRGESSAVGEYPSLQPLHLLAPSRLEVGSSPTTGLDVISPSQRHVQIAQDLRSSLPSACRWLGPGGIKLVGEHPIAAGGFANIYDATLDGRKVALKSRRCYESFDVTQAVAMFHNEVHVWTLLHHGDVEVVSLVGVYSTEAHPFGLVYEYMDGLDLKQYMKNEPNLRRLKLLIGIARGLKRMHDLGIVHGNLQSANILVDKEGTVRIAGLGNAIVLPHSTTYPLEGRTNTDRLSCGRAPELTWPGVSQSVADPIHPTKASDMYGFGVVAWEPPFSEMTEIAATYAMLSGARPLRQTHHEISDRLWYMIERCWYNLPLKRVSAGEAVQLLEAELGHAPNSRTLPHT